MKHTIWYFGLAAQKERYTEQLSHHWMPDAFDHACKGTDVQWQSLEPSTVGLNTSIQNGKVLDDYSRACYSMDQCKMFLDCVEQGLVHDGDAIFLQDYWTPGIEGVFCVLHQRNIKVRLYAMCHAQTVDEFDFTYPMRDWMRHSELAIKEWITKFGGAIFVASTVHKEQLRSAGFSVPIHVVSLPIDMLHVQKHVARLVTPTERRGVVFASRLHSEKQPLYMLSVAREFLQDNIDETWTITTSASAKSVAAGAPSNFLKELHAMEHDFGDRFRFRVGLSKDEYYTELCGAVCIFNCSLQDYVSWTLLEGIVCGCAPVYPKVRSFPECLPVKHLYEPYFGAPDDTRERKRVLCAAFESTRNAVGKLKDQINLFSVSPEVTHTLLRSNAGRLLEAALVVHDLSHHRDSKEVDIWKLPIAVIEAMNLGYKPKNRK